MERTYATPLLDKLGVRPGMRVAIVGPVDPDGTFRELLGDRTSDITVGDPAADTNLVFLAADSLADLDALAALRARIRPNGAIWVVSRKGRAATLRDVEVIGAAKANDLVDNKVVAFSDTHTSLRLVIPRRPPAARLTEYHPRMGEWIVVLVVVLVIVLLWRGPKTLPKLGSAFGRSIRDFRREIDKNDDDPEAPEAPDRPA